MDGDGTIERVWQQAIGQFDAERAAHGAGTAIIAGGLTQGQEPCEVGVSVRTSK